MRAACETNLPESVWYVTRQQLAGLHENIECLLTCSMLCRGEERILLILSKRRVVEVQQSHLHGAKLRLGQSQHTSVLVATATATATATRTSEHSAHIEVLASTARSLHVPLTIHVCDGSLALAANHPSRVVMYKGISCIQRAARMGKPCATAGCSLVRHVG